MTIRRLIMPLTVAIIAIHATSAHAQGPSQGAAAPPINDPAIPPVNGAATSVPGGEECMNGLLPLRQEAEKRGAMIKTASERDAPPDEICKLIGEFAQSERKMIRYVESQQQKCEIPPKVADQLKVGHSNTENMLKKLCDAISGRDRKMLKIANRARLRML